MWWVTYLCLEEPYVRRWLVTHPAKHPAGGADEVNKLASKIIYGAWLEYYIAHAPYTKFLDCLIAGEYVEGPENKRVKTLLSEGCSIGDKDVVCITNGFYAYYFAIYKQEKSGFLAWAKTEWSAMEKPKNVKVDWPIIHLKSSEYPIHARLIPGCPLADETLEFRL